MKQKAKSKSWNSKFFVIIIIIIKLNTKYKHISGQWVHATRCWILAEYILRMFLQYVFHFVITICFSTKKTYYLYRPVVITAPQLTESTCYESSVTSCKVWWQCIIQYEAEINNQKAHSLGKTTFSFYNAHTQNYHISTGVHRGGEISVFKLPLNLRNLFICVCTKKLSHLCSYTN